MTTFTDESIALANGNGRMELHNICFRGSGGVGMSCKETLFLYDCTFEDWDIGVHIQDYGWSHSDTCTYRGNGIGLLFDCTESGSFGPDYDSNIFEQNEIGVQVKGVSNPMPLAFDFCIFRDNGLDIDNIIDHELDLSRSVFLSNS